MINKCYNFLNFESWSRVFIKIAYLYHFLRIFKSISNSTSSIINFVEKKKNRKSSSNSDYSNGKCSRPFSASYVTTWNSTCLAEILDPPIFFFFLHISTFPWILRFTSGLKFTMLSPPSPIFHYTFLPKGCLSRSYRFPQTAIEPVSFRGYLLSHLELSLDRMLYWLIVLYLFFFFIIIRVERWITGTDRIEDLLKLHNDVIKLRRKIVFLKRDIIK